MSKYHNKKAVYNGMVFDSKKEMNRYIELSLLENAGKISKLKRQVEYLLIPAQFGMVTDDKGKKKRVCLERACYYIADFTYYENGKLVVEDVKSGYKKSNAYSNFVIKRKLLLLNYGIRIKET